MIDRLLNMLPIVSCQEATRLSSLRMERRLSIKEWIDLRLHLIVCDLCKNFQQQISGLRILLRKEIHLPPAAKKKMKKALQDLNT